MFTPLLARPIGGPRASAAEVRCHRARAASAHLHASVARCSGPELRQAGVASIRVQRILDIDLDFFVERVMYFRQNDGTRPAADEYPVWSIEAVLEFLHERCALRGPLPGITAERHHEVFYAWRDLIEAGRLEPPFSVTHVDAHADLGRGPRLRPPDGGHPSPAGPRSNTTRHWRAGADRGELAAVRNRLPLASDLTFVFNDDRQSDVFVHHLEDNDPEAMNIQLKAVAEGEINRRFFQLNRVEVLAHEPLVPYREVLWSNFQTGEPFDFICLCRSPDYAPASADEIYEEVRRRFVVPVQA